MPNTTVRMDIVDDALPTSVIMEAAETGLVAPNAAGYSLSSVGEWEWEFTVPEACVGVYRVYATDGDGVTVSQGYVWIAADDTGTYIAVADFGTAKSLSLNTIADTLVTEWADGGRLDLILDAILEDTNMLQTDWTDGGRLDLILDAIQVQADLIGTGSAFLTTPVSLNGTINGSIIIGDDYNAANERAFEWEFAAITGFNAGTATGKFGAKHVNRPNDYSFLVTNGTVTDEGGGTWKVSFDLDKTDTESLIEGSYDWSVEIVDGGEEITIAGNTETPRNLLKLAEKQT